MNKVQLNWDVAVFRFHEAEKSRHPFLQKQGFYVLLSARLDEEADLWRELKILHIGYALNTTLRVELMRSQEAFDNALAKVGEGAEVVVMVAEITESSLKRKTVEFMNAILACLRQHNLPKLGTALASPPTQDIRVSNMGDHLPLKARSRCSPVSAEYFFTD